MIVVVANHIPDAIRGKMKLWFCEPKPNVFISGIKDSLADNVTDLLLKECPISSGLLIFKEINTPPFFRIYMKGNSFKNISTISGLQLIVEKLPPITFP